MKARAASRVRSTPGDRPVGDDRGVLTSWVMRTWTFLIIIVCAIACQKNEPAKTGDGTGTAAAKVDDSVEIFVDDKSVAKITTKDLASWPRLDALVPQESRRLGTWTGLAFVTATAPQTLDRPAQNHPDKMPVLFAGKDGTASFGMFDAVEYAKKGEPSYRVDGVRQIKLTLSKAERGGDHQGGGGEGADITKLVLEIVTKDGTKQLTGPEILKLPREDQPNNDDTKGWRITQFLEAAGVTKFEGLTLYDKSGASLPLTKKELDPKTSVPFVKLNKSGVLRFRMFTKQGAGWSAGADLRGLAKIEVK